MTYLKSVLFLCLLVVRVTSTKESMYDDYRYMSNLSKYEAIRGDVRNLIHTHLGKCTPIRLWILHRHGTRTPSTSDIKLIETLLSLKDKILANHVKGRGSLSEEELVRLRQWTFDTSMEAIPMYLTEEGYNETYRTALRFKETFPTLLNREYKEDDFYFRHTDTQRTMETSHAFIDALFGVGARKKVNDIVYSTDNDFLLYPFGGACKKLADLNSDPNSYAVLQKFMETKHVLDVSKSISSRLGFKETLEPANITTMFAACGYDSAWSQESGILGAWCSVLGSEGRKIGEYASDLLFQAMSGYGNDVTERAGCGPPKDLWERFASAAGELDRPNKDQSVTALFTHDTVITLVHTALGLLKDHAKLTETNYALQNLRQWRTSKVVPFAANVAATLLKCRNLLGPNELKVIFFRNEQPLEGIPNCPFGICTWKNFKNFIKPVADSCFKDIFC